MLMHYRMCVVLKISWMEFCKFSAYTIKQANAVALLMLLPLIDSHYSRFQL